MKRYALYARYSSEHQNERSIDDQVALCRAEIERRGGTLGEIYADYAISGSHMRSRPRMLQLMDDARDGRFDVVIAEARSTSGCASPAFGSSPWAKAISTSCISA